MGGISKILILLILVFGDSTLFAQAGSGNFFNRVDTAIINTAKDTLAGNISQDTLVVNTGNDSLVIKHHVTADTTLYRLILHYRDSVRYNLKRPYNKDAFKFKDDSLWERIKEPWLGDILKEFFFR